MHTCSALAMRTQDSVSSALSRAHRRASMFHTWSSASWRARSASYSAVRCVSTSASLVNTCGERRVVSGPYCSLMGQAAARRHRTRWKVRLLHDEPSTRPPLPSSLGLDEEGCLYGRSRRRLRGRRRRRLRIRGILVVRPTIFRHILEHRAEVAEPALAHLFVRHPAVDGLSGASSVRRRSFCAACCHGPRTPRRTSVRIGRRGPCLNRIRFRQSLSHTRIPKGHHGTFLGFGRRASKWQSHVPERSEHDKRVGLVWNHYANALGTRVVRNEGSVADFFAGVLPAARLPP